MRRRKNYRNRTPHCYAFDMSGEIVAAGDIATGMLVGRAVEPRAGEMSHDAGVGSGGLCLNCGTALRGDFCHACGQGAHVHRTLHSILHDLLHGVFHFEGKIWRTLPMLVLHPGVLTRRYIAGERARFVSPLALFLFSVFLMFATIHAFESEWSTALPSAARTAAVPDLDADIAKGTAKLKQIEAGPQSAASERAKADVRKELQALKAVRSVMTGAVRPETEFNLDSVKTSWRALDKGLAKAKANPGLVIYKLESSAYKYSWALIPISTPFVALLFVWRRRYKMYDHAIFVTYSMAFMTMLVVVLRLSVAIGVSTSLVSSAALLVPPAHMFAQLRGAYSLRKRSALWRTVALLLFAWIALIAFMCLLLVMGLME